MMMQSSIPWPSSLAKVGLAVGLMLFSNPFWPLSVSALSLQTPAEGVEQKQGEKQPTDVPSSQVSNTTEFNREPWLDLVRAMRDLAGESDRYFIESDMQMTVRTPGGDLQFMIHVATTAEMPNRFHSTIRFQGSDSSLGSRDYMMVSNGSQVWIQDKQQNSYSEMTYEALETYRDDIFRGLFTSFITDVLGDPTVVGPLQEASDAELVEALEPMFAANQVALNDIVITEEGQHRTYEYTDPVQGYVLRAALDRATLDVNTLTISGPAEGFDFSMEETIVQRTSLPWIPEETFEFNPLVGMEKVDEPISISPF